MAPREYRVWIDSSNAYQHVMGEGFDGDEQLIGIDALRSVLIHALHSGYREILVNGRKLDVLAEAMDDRYLSKYYDLYIARMRFTETPQSPIRIYQELLKEASQSPALLNNLAYLYAEQSTDKNTLAEGSKLATLALAQEPENPSLLDTAAWLAYKQGDFEAAWKYAQDAVVRAPEAGVHNLHAAIILHARGEKGQALEYLDKALSVQMDAKSKQQAEALKLEWSR